jgi:hypothetical protein
MVPLNSLESPKVKKPLFVIGPTLQRFLASHSSDGVLKLIGISKGQKTVVCNCYLLCNGIWLRTHQMVPLNSLESPKVKKPLFVIGTYVCNGFLINLVLRASIQNYQGLNQRQKTAVSD